LLPPQLRKQWLVAQSSKVMLSIKVGWAIVAAFAQNDKDYTNTWGEAISKTVKAAALFPSFCKDVENAYGPNGIAAPELPWVRSPDAAAFRGMLK
jgi:hypothetical protein